MTTFKGVPRRIKIGLFALLLTIYSSCSTKDRTNTKIGGKDLFVSLLPYKGFDPILINFIQKETETFYHCRVVVLTPVTLPAFAFYAERARYKAASLLIYENGLIIKGVKSIVGLTNKDISTSKDNIPDWGVFGLGRCPGNVCVVSIFRLQGISVSNEKLKERLIKVVLHEIGHNLGLPHCSNNAECIMTDASDTIKQVDREKKWLCPACRRKLSM